MTFSPKSLFSVRIPFAIVVIVLWNFGFLVARALGAPFSRSGLIVGGLTAVLMSACIVAIVRSPEFRRVAIHPSRRHLYEPGAFVFIALAAGIVGVGWLILGGFNVFSELQPPSNTPVHLTSASCRR